MITRSCYSCSNVFLSVVKLGSKQTMRFASASSAVVHREMSLHRAYEVLGVSRDDSAEIVRDSFLQLAKQYHPDSVGGDKNKFISIQEAYEKVLEASKQGPVEVERSEALKEWEQEGEEKLEATTDQDIRHTAPQHRQYLEYDGHGSGTPFDRQRQYQSMRAMRARHSATTYQIDRLSTVDLASHGETALSVREKTRAQKFRAPNAVEMLVEDLIQESMARGDFANLKGYGKPLKHSVEEPYVDFTTRKLNEMLIDNGFMPEWLLLRREIEQEREQLRSKLKSIAATLNAIDGPDVPQWKWNRACDEASLPDDLRSINKKIDKYNLLCPALHCQLVQLYMKREAECAIAECREKPESVPANTVRIVKPDWGVECDPKKAQINTVEDKQEAFKMVKKMFKQLSFSSLLSR